MKKIFISYSMDNEQHVRMVKTLARCLSANGIEVLLDQEVLDIGDNKDAFMEKLSESDFMLPILTPDYHRKVKERSPGVGYEFTIINDYLQRNALNNLKVFPVLLSGEEEESIPVQLRPFKYLDLRDEENFEINIEKLIQRINRDVSFLKTKNIKPVELPVKSFNNLTDMDNEIIYADSQIIRNAIEDHFEDYFDKCFFGKGKNKNTEQVIHKLNEIEETVEEYAQSFHQQFKLEKMLIYEKRLLDFRDKIVSEHLWTVKSALASREHELIRYKASFKKAKLKELYNVIRNILTFSDDYSLKIWPTIKADKIQSVDDLKLDDIYKDNLILPGVIGLGIRSEILHRQYPGIFPIMTRRSLWGMHYLAGNAMEFLKYEYDNYNEKTRIVNQFEYDYARFTYYINHLTLLLKNKIISLGIPWKENLRFGYTNLFITRAFEMNKHSYKELHDWK